MYSNSEVSARNFLARTRVDTDESAVKFISVSLHRALAQYEDNNLTTVTKEVNLVLDLPGLQIRGTGTRCKTIGSSLRIRVEKICKMYLWNGDNSVCMVLQVGDVGCVINTVITRGWSTRCVLKCNIYIYRQVETKVSV